MIWLQSLRRRDEGQDLLEYAMLASLIAIACLVALSTLATEITETFWGAIAALDL
jgi:Flp pilus assembly pilin Flp